MKMPPCWVAPKRTDHVRQLRRHYLGSCDRLTVLSSKAHKKRMLTSDSSRQAPKPEKPNSHSNNCDVTLEIETDLEPLLLDLQTEPCEIWRGSLKHFVFGGTQVATIVATGTNGFIGTNVVEALLNASNLDVCGTTANSLKVAKDAKAFELAICSDLPETTNRAQHARLGNYNQISFVPHTELSQFVRSLPQKPLALVHNGACSSTEETNQQVFDRLNLDYSKAMWELCSDLQIPFLYASSAGVYGSGAKGFSDKKEDCAKYEPLSLYAKSKHDFDLWALQQKKTPPSWFGLRYFNVYGPHEEHKGRQASMVLHLFNQISQTGKVKLYKSTTPEYEDGGQVRDFVYVNDIAKITINLIKLARERLEFPDSHPIDGNGLFLNVGTGTPQSWNYLVREVFASLNLQPNIEYIEMPASLAKQYQNYTCANLASWNSLGITLKPTPLAGGVSEYVKTHLLAHNNR